MSGRNWTANRRRKVMDSHGTAWSKDHEGMMTPLLGPRRQRPPQPTKADMRSETERLIADFSAKAQG